VRQRVATVPDSKRLTNPIDRLAELTGGKWPSLIAAREYTRAKRTELQRLLDQIDTNDTSIVVFGSLARDEATAGSDTDWTLLVDGIADPSHVTSAHEVRRRLERVGATKPGPEGTFGAFAFSHQILHWIGGEDDSNANTTRRILLLLESKPLGQPDALDRVLNNVLSRYLNEDRGLQDSSKERRIPLFLLNDIARYWRIMVVDFAYKQSARGNRGYALRSIKLGLSRKLIFVSGLLACFSCRLDFSDEQWSEISRTGNRQPLIAHLRAVLKMTPLEIVATRLANYESALPISKRLFDAYDKFIGLLADNTPTAGGKAPREHLGDLPVEGLESDTLFQEARRIRREFSNALSDLFLKPGIELYDLTVKYGVF
jgi:predicted nucleotidyltransferase